MTITRMQEPRQLYGLGSLVKKITKPIKKIVKSPIGKAALLGAAAFGIPGTGIGGLFGRAGFGGAATGLLGKQGIGATLFGVGALPPSQGLGVDKGLFGKFFGKMGTGTKLGIAGGLLTYLGSQGMSEEEIEETKRDPDKLRVYLKDYFSKLNPNASDEEVEQFVETNVSEYATGGRVGFKDGKNMKMASAPDLEDSRNDMANQMFGKDLRLLTEEELEMLEDEIDRLSIKFMANGGMPTGIMRTNQAGTIERDYRETGGFVPVGIKEKADDVPAMLSKTDRDWET